MELFMRWHGSQVADILQGINNI